MLSARPRPPSEDCELWRLRSFHPEGRRTLTTAGKERDSIHHHLLEAISETATCATFGTKAFCTPPPLGGGGVGGGGV